MLQIQRNFYILIFLFVLSCNKEVKTSFSEINITTENNAIVEVNVPEANGKKTITEQINSEITKTIAAALHIGDPDSVPSVSVEESIKRFNEEFQDFKRDFPETELPWEAQIDGEVVYQSPEIICVAITTYTNTGGAHGLSNVTFLNFNATTGNKISNEKLITDFEAFKKMAKPYFDKAIAEKEHAIFDTEAFQLPANIGYTEDGLVLLYNTYEIAPYSTGIIEFKIPYEEAEPFLAFNHL
ncbi:DUF3298 and DUF4163 domain-containing protein [Tamlana crocina]|uniref:DUF3298 and DUF4163 domain-containing protein n=1 Tax=Tamlana crocina TaxID=393006 RepID=A0ABX1DCC2_9FLAO|nr:DUF3298 and DUF4163 domain-containing protein [Tamlana crocina]NJX16014.1 DUF3298 and DUF4163 domain-containing protein [Tamlana crocina]